MQACENGMGDIGMIKGGACLEASLKGEKGRRRRSRSQGINNGLGVYQREEGEETINAEQTDA